MQDDRRPFLDYLARCQQAFRPFAPIDLPEFFKGRREHVQLLISELSSPGRQVAIYGERGVGKTSLAMLAPFFANYSDQATFFVRCDRGSTFETVFGQVLMYAGKPYVLNGTEIESSSDMSLRPGPAALAKKRTTRSRQQAIEAARQVGPAMLLARLRDREGLLIVDEYDRVRDPLTHVRVAETLKHFSDADSKTKIIIVGVAETLSELIGEHQSLTRCLAQIKLARMEEDELGEIVATGEERIGAAFHEGIRSKIVALSDGFPFYTHLLCLYCAQEAGKVLAGNPGARVVVTEVEYRKAIRRAIETAESALHDDYQAAVVTIKRKTDMFKNVLWAVAYAEAQEVQIQQIADNIGLLTGQRPKIESLSNYLGPLVKPEKKRVLARVRQGYYKFSNPLMRSYIRLLLEDYNIVETDGQMRFPWMRQEKR